MLSNENEAAFAPRAAPAMNPGFTIKTCLSVTIIACLDRPEKMVMTSSSLASLLSAAWRVFLCS
jgi:hypothetical protein